MKLQDKIFNFSKGLMLVLALFFSSCEDSESLDSIGEIPDRIDLFYTELTLPSSLILKDSINTTAPSRWLAGRYQNDEIGQVSHEFYTMFRQSFDSLDVSSQGTNEFEGLYLVLESDNYLFGPDGKIKLDVYQLDQPLRNTSQLEDVYYSKDFVTINPANKLNIETQEFDLEKDSTFSIRLDNALGMTFFDRQNEFADTANFKQEDFNAFIKGIAVVPTSDTRNVLGFSNNSQSYLSLKYKIHEDTTKEIKYYTTFLRDTLDDNYVTGFNHYEADRTGTDLAGLTEFDTDFQPANGKYYVQSAYGLHTAIDFSVIKDLEDTIIINYAEFELPTSREEEKYVTPPGQLGFTYVYSDQTNEEHNKRIKTPDNFQFLYYTMQIDGADPTSFGNELMGKLNRDSYTYYSSRAFNGLTNTIFTQALLGTYNESPENIFEMKDQEGNLLEKVIIEPSNGRNQANYLIGEQDAIKLKIYYSKIK